MDRVGVDYYLVLVCFMSLIMFPLTTTVYADFQVDVLVAFRNGLQDPRNSLWSWNASDGNPCNWMSTSLQRFACNPDNYVTTIDLGSLELSGPLTPSLGTLTNLTVLNLYSNDFNGPIPPELGNLTNLTQLNLSGNNLSGRVPDEVIALNRSRIIRIFDLSYNPELCGPGTDHPCN